MMEETGIGHLLLYLTSFYDAFIARNYLFSAKSTLSKRPRLAHLVTNNESQLNFCY